MECSTKASGSPTYIFCPSNGLASFACLRADASTAFSSDSSCNNEEIDSVNGICNTPLTTLSPSLSSQEAVRRNVSDKTKATIFEGLTYSQLFLPPLMTP